MASSSGALEVMGHKQRLKISSFSGTESFPLYQSQLQQQGIFTFISSMDIKCEADFEKVLADITAQAADQGSIEKRANLQVLLAKKKTYQQDDYNFQVSPTFSQRDCTNRRFSSTNSICFARKTSTAWLSSLSTSSKRIW